MIRTSRRYNRRTRFWFTETGGVVKFGRSWPCNTYPRGAAAALPVLAGAALPPPWRAPGVRLQLDVLAVVRFDAGLTNPDGSVRPGYGYLRRALPRYRALEADPGIARERVHARFVATHLHLVAGPDRPAGVHLVAAEARDDDRLLAGPGE